MKIEIPEQALVVLIGPSGSGKSTFARAHFQPFETLSSDFCRGLVANNENDQTATDDAFAVLHYIAAKRLAAGRLTVIDATNVQAESRESLLALAREYYCLAVAIVFNLPESVCLERNRLRPDRDFGPHVIRRQRLQLKRSLHGLKREGFSQIYVLSSSEEVAAVTLERRPLWNNLKHEPGPFDIIGDVHGCADELEQLLDKLGYQWTAQADVAGLSYSRLYHHPAGRKAIFLGDLVDRGPRILDTVQLVQAMVKAGQAYCVPGNHEEKLLRKLAGKNVTMQHGLEQTVAELEALPEDKRGILIEGIAEFFDSLISHYVLDEGQLVVAHAGLKQAMQGRASGKVREFTLYGETTGETDEFGLPIRYNWAAEYRGAAMVVYGHTPVPQAEWLNRTINIDTGCVFGGALTALRYPELELVSVPAARVYAEPQRPLTMPLAQALTAQQQHDDVLDIADFIGKHIISTRLQPSVTIQAENSTAALEVMSRFAINPKWLIYLPPTMSPPMTSAEPDYLEHPKQVFDYYRKEGVTQLICEEKHMGSRAIVIVGRDEGAIRRRFGVIDEGFGICYTRTGRRFFEDSALEIALLTQVRSALDRSNIWAKLNTDWICLDCELMPWSAKAQELLRDQYAAVGAAGRAGLQATIEVIDQAAATGLDLAALQTHFAERAGTIDQYVAAYRRYCWSVQSIDDFKLAPFHVLAAEDAVHTDKSHVWHMETIGRFVLGAPCLYPTIYQLVDLNVADSEQAAVEWWEQLTATGGEGIVTKPLDFIARSGRGVVQPAMKCRGREYLRIIYGPEYTVPDHLARLRTRNVAAKRSLAAREFALGVEALERFVRGEPLRRVHECVFGVLALESEPVDPRL